MPSVAQYYPGDFWADTRQSLEWILARQGAAVSPWQANAVSTAAFAECGLASTADLSRFPCLPIENLVIDPPPGVLPDPSPGPDGFPINFSPLGLPGGNLLLNTFVNARVQTVRGRCFSLLQPLANYRVDLFAHTDLFYYQGSSPLADGGGGSATWSVPNVNAGAVLAVLYPATVAPPAPGAGFASLPPGWVAHSNMGTGKKLASYFARIYVKTDIEYLQEDHVPILVQDSYHARCGSSVALAAGLPTVHIIWNDPVAGPTMVYTSLQRLAAYQGLPRSFQVPVSDPLYVPDVTATNAAALQNRSFIYDDALFILACCGAGNFAAASKTIRQLNGLLDHPGYLPSRILENAEDGSTARWSKSNPSDSIAVQNDPVEPPYGTGNVMHFQALAAGDAFTYVGSEFPDANDTQVEFEHREAASLPFVFSIGVTTASGAVTAVNITSDAVGPASYNAAAKTITIPVGPGDNTYRTNLVPLASLISSLASDRLTAITSFKITVGAAGDLYLDNLSVGTEQPAGSLSFSYDVYNGQVDQAYIRTGAMAWVCYAYAVYMAMSLDYSPALYLERMLRFLLGLQSSAGDLTHGLLYLGYGSYRDPGYQFVPGLQTFVSTEHNIDAYFAFQRAANVLPTAAVQLQKAGAITASQAAALGTTAVAVAAAADTIASSLMTNLYIPPGTDPGHFAQGASAAGLDTSQALDASGAWAALLCHALGDDVKAAECLKFAHQKFYLTKQQILISSAAGSYNQAYQQLTPFSGFKPYNDSTGGYSGSPLSVGQEGTWGVILALLRLYDVPAVQSYFAGAAGGLDTFLSSLISDQRLVRSTTGDGSLLAFSLAARGLPWEFEVWPALSPTAWFWLVSTRPSLLLSAGTDPQVLPYLLVPAGQHQTVNELEGSSSIGRLQVESIDPGGTLKALAAQQNFVGRVARLKMGFAGQSLGDFVTLHTLQILSTGFSTDGRITLQCADVQRFLTGQLWSHGGPSPWTPGWPAPLQPSGPAFAANAFPVSDSNPRWLSGNPLDIFLVAMQNELGVGQDPSVPPEGWALYQPGKDETLINPNPYLDVAGILALRDTLFSGDWFTFKLTRPVDGKQWLEDQILKVLGLYTIVRADGRLSLKGMKSPLASQPVMALNPRNVMGIPEVARRPVINVVTVRFSADDSERETAARQYQDEVTFQQATSIALYKQRYKQQIEADGLRLASGGLLRAFLLADRIFRRHAFGTPAYRVRAFLSAIALEPGDLVWFSHPLVPDFQTGSAGLNNVICEVSERQPNYAEGYVEFELLDTRFMSLTRPYQIAAASAGVPTWGNATPAQRAQYMFLSLAAQGGRNADGSPGNTIF
jgi:hypothetical protein